MAQRRNKNIIKYRKPIRVNIGLVLFLFLMVYLVIVVVLYFTRTRIRIYQVESGSVVNDQTYTGLILRDEQVFAMDQSGYVDFYVREGRRVGKDDIVYTIDVNGTFSEQLQATLEGMDSFSDTAIESIKKELYEFSSGYQDMSFDEVYTVKNGLELEIINDLSNSALESLDELVNTDSFVQGRAALSGVVSYRIDGYESVTEENLTQALMNPDGETVNVQRTGSLLEAGTSIYKIIPDESWRLALQVDEEKYAELSAVLNSEDETANRQIRFRITDTGQELSADFELVTGSDGARFCVLSIPKYGSRYAEERFLDVELIYEEESGLKIPKTSVMTQSFFLIPQEYATYGGNQNVYGFNRQAAGSDTVEFVSPTFYALVDGYYYVNQTEFSAGDRIFLPDSDEQYVIAETGELQGVFNINRGYAVFRRVVILDEAGDMYLIEKGTTYGLSVYDHIILNNRGIEEFDVIY